MTTKINFYYPISQPHSSYQPDSQIYGNLVFKKLVCHPNQSPNLMLQIQITIKTSQMHNSKIHQITLHSNLNSTISNHFNSEISTPSKSFDCLSQHSFFQLTQQKNIILNQQQYLKPQPLKSQLKYSQKVNRKGLQTDMPGTKGESCEFGEERNIFRDGQKRLVDEQTNKQNMPDRNMRIRSKKSLKVRKVSKAEPGAQILYSKQPQIQKVNYCIHTNKALTLSIQSKALCLQHQPEQTFIQNPRTPFGVQKQIKKSISLTADHLVTMIPDIEIESKIFMDNIESAQGQKDRYSSYKTFSECDSSKFANYCNELSTPVFVENKREQKTWEKKRIEENLLLVQKQKIRELQNYLSYIILQKKISLKQLEIEGYRNYGHKKSKSQKIVRAPKTINLQMKTIRREQEKLQKYEEICMHNIMVMKKRGQKQTPELKCVI